MLVAVRIDVGAHEILSWSILAIEELCMVLELYNGIRDCHIQVPSTTGHQLAKLGEIAAFGTCIKFSLEQSKDAKPSKQPPIRSVNQALMQAEVSGSGMVDMRIVRAHELI